MGILVFPLILSGMVMLGFALVPIMAMLPMIGQGRLRRSWIALAVMILAFILGYACFALLCLRTRLETLHVVVSIILAAGGAFVLAVSRLSRTTAQDIARIAALERDVILDPLTGIFNRRYLDARMSEEVTRADQGQLDLSILLIDLDHFKRINDTYGHVIGDFVLRQMCSLIARLSRPTDTVARYGGEEILVVAPGSRDDDAHAFARRLCQSMAEERLHLPEGGHISVTASIGVASLLPHETTDKLIRRADVALYRAKDEGRNRVIMAPNVPIPEAQAA